MNICGVEGCSRSVVSKGFCKMHYYRIRSNGGVMRRTKNDKNNIYIRDGAAVVEMYDMLGIKTSETTIDISDVEAVSKHKWYLGKRGYPSSRINKKLICLHKFLTGFSQTDHIDGNPLNNTRKNLRPSTQTQNIWNSNVKTGGTSRYKGVYLSSRSGKWCVQCKRKYYGQYEDELDAAIAYNIAATKTFGEYARLNDI